jgi:hypothetical protein
MVSVPYVCFLLHGLEQLIFHFSFLTDDGAFQYGKAHMVVGMTYMIECSDAVKAFRLQKNASVDNRQRSLEEELARIREEIKPMDANEIAAITISLGFVAAALVWLVWWELK